MSELAEDVPDDETMEPAAKSVPPRMPPVQMKSGEHVLPSVIVDLADLEASAPFTVPLDTRDESERQSDIDVLLESSEVAEEIRRQPTMPTIDTIERGRGYARSFTIGLLAALAIGGGALGVFLRLAHHIH